MPPGDILLGGILGGSWLPPAISRFNAAAQPSNALGSQAETRLVKMEHLPQESFYAALIQSITLNFIFTSPTNQGPYGTNGSQADPARPENPDRIRPAFREASGLDEGPLDQLLGDDFDQLSSSPLQAGMKRGTRGLTAGLDHAATMGVGGSGAVGGSFPSVGQGLQAPSAPFIPDAQNGGLMGGGGGGSAQAPAGSGSTSPNLVTGGHFATLGNQHGTVTPFLSSAVWPSYTPPTSTGSGGGPQATTSSKTQIGT